MPIVQMGGNRRQAEAAVINRQLIALPDQNRTLFWMSQYAVTLNDQWTRSDSVETPDRLWRKFVRRSHSYQPGALRQLVKSQRRKLLVSLMRNSPGFARRGVRCDSWRWSERCNRFENRQPGHVFDEGCRRWANRMVTGECETGSGPRMGAQSLLRDEYARGSQQTHLHEIAPFQSGSDQLAPVRRRNLALLFSSQISV